MPGSVCFETVYRPGRVEAISYTGSAEVSRAVLETTGAPARIRLLPEKEQMQADGHDLIYVNIQIEDAQGRVVPNAEIHLSAEAAGSGWLAAFGTGNPVTAENYTDRNTVSWRGRAQAVLRAGYDPGSLSLTVAADGLAAETVRLDVTL